MERNSIAGGATNFVLSIFTKFRNNFRIFLRYINVNCIKWLSDKA